MSKHRGTCWTTERFFAGAIILLFLVPSFSVSSTYYVVALGRGNHTGSDWANANCRIPASLAAGDVVYVGNSGGNLANTTTPCAGEAYHVFADSGTPNSHIRIIAATGVDHGTATGWQTSYGVDANPGITWSNSFVPGDNGGAPHLPIWDFCGSYYDVDGKVGTGEQTGSFGFYFRSAGRMFGFIRIDPDGACGHVPLQSFTFQNLELDGVDPNDGLNGTYSGAEGFSLGGPVTSTAVISNITVAYAYIHDMSDHMGGAGNINGLTVHDVRLSSNFSDTHQHGNSISFNHPAGGFSLKNFAAYNNIFKNIQGTGVMVCLNGACDNWQVYNNLIYYTLDWDSICEHGDPSAACTMSKVIGDNDTSGNSPLTHLVFYGNTIANIHMKPGHPGADQAGVIIQYGKSTGNVVQNNLWWNCTQGSMIKDSNPLKITHDYNTWLNTGTAGTTLGAHDFSISPAANPFVSELTGDFHFSSGAVVAHLNDGTTLPPPYNTDLTGAPRGQNGTWERGAFESHLASSAPDPPTNLSVTVH
jgi:hypothetical protein